jgi:RNA polymerase sigma-70 factor (ECF subfamily)
MQEGVTVSTLHDMSDERLMKRYADGDSLAFDELFHRYEQRAYEFFFVRTRSDDRARDLYQELFFRIHRARFSFDPTRRFAPWFFQIASRLLVDDLRRAFRSREVPLSADGVARVESDVEARLLDSERVEQVLEQLSPEERRVLICAKVEGARYDEIARELGKSTDAVKKVASRAMQRLRAAASEERRLAAHA